MDDLRTTQYVVAGLALFAGVLLMSAWVLFLRRKVAQGRLRRKWVVRALALVGACLIWGLIVQPMLSTYGPGATVTHDASRSVVTGTLVVAPPPPPRRTTFTHDEIQIATWIFTYLNWIAAVLFFGGLLGTIYGAVRKWRFRYIWLITAFGMVGAYLIWDIGVFVALNAYLPGISRHVLPKDFGDQPGVVAAFFCAPFWAFMVYCVTEGARWLLRACRRLAGSRTPT